MLTKKGTSNHHFKFLAELGMVVIQTKTEVMIMAKRGIPTPQSITVGTVILQVQQAMKVLGILFDHQMTMNILEKYNNE